jgi:hypothetical protein
MAVPDNLKPMEMDSADFARNRYRVSVPGLTTWADILADRTFFRHLVPDGRLMPGIQIEITSAAGLFDALVHVEAVDQASHSVEVRALRVFEATRVPAAELETGGLGVKWLDGTARWAIVALTPDDGADPIVRGGYATAKLAAAGLALLAGTNKKRVKSAA